MSKSGWTIFPSLNVSYMESGRAFLKTALLQKQTDLGFISSNISVSAENLIETTQKINYTQPLQLILEEYRIKPWTQYNVVKHKVGRKA
jgi:hypothetical protein